MRNRVLLVFLAVALVVSLVAFAACAKEEEVVTEEWQYPERLFFTTLSPQSANYGALVAWTTLMAKDTGMTVRIVCEMDASLQMMWVKEGRFFSVGPFQNRGMLYAHGDFARRDGGPWQSRIWMPAGVAYWGFNALGDSGIKTPYDIKPGMKIFYFPLVEEGIQNMYALMAWAQVDLEDVTWVPVSDISQMGRLLMDGKYDVCDSCSGLKPMMRPVMSSPVVRICARPTGKGPVQG